MPLPTRAARAGRCVAGPLVARDERAWGRVRRRRKGGFGAGGGEEEGRGGKASAWRRARGPSRRPPRRPWRAFSPSPLLSSHPRSGPAPTRLAFPPRGGGSEGSGGGVRPASAFGAGRAPVAAPPALVGATATARLGTRGAAAGPRGVSPGRVLPRLRGGPRSLGSRGAPRRPPPPAARPGRLCGPSGPPSRAGSVGALAPFAGPAAAGVRRRGGWPRGPRSPHLARPHPVQVPSASRRGGLKTLWGVARPPRVGGGRARGESWRLGLPRSPPDSRRPAPRRPRPGCRRAAPTPRSSPDAGRGLPGGRRVVRERVCERAAPRLWCPGGRGRRWETPLGACGVFRARPPRVRVGGAACPDGTPPLSNPSDLSESGVVVSSWPAGGALRGWAVVRSGGRWPS